jgi:hypothetical protein
MRVGQVPGNPSSPGRHGTCITAGAMTMPADMPSLPNRDPRALRIIAKSIHKEMRANGYAEEDVVRLASELLDLVATEKKERRCAKG